MNIYRFLVFALITVLLSCRVHSVEDPSPRYSIGPAKTYLVSGKQEVLVCFATFLQLPPESVFGAPPRTLETTVQLYLCDVKSQRGTMLGSIATKESRTVWMHLGVEGWTKDAVYVIAEGYSELRGGRLVEHYRFGLDGNSSEVPKAPDGARRVDSWQGMPVVFEDKPPVPSSQPPFFARLAASESPEPITVELGRGGRTSSDVVWSPSFQIWSRSQTVTFIGGQQPGAHAPELNRNGLPN